MKKYISISIPVVFFSFFLFQPYSLGAIISLDSVLTNGNTSGGGISVAGLAVGPNNDDITVFNVGDRLLGSNHEFSSIGPVDVLFIATNSGAPTEYTFTGFGGTVEIRNSTDRGWDGFSFQLGYGNGGGFIPSNVTDSLDFDAPTATALPVPISDVFGSFVQTSNQLTWSNGVVPIGGTVGFEFNIDVPETNTGPPGSIPSAHIRSPNSFDFTLRFNPTSTLDPPPASTSVPEPATLGLLALGLAGAAFRRRKK